ncbi:hypothetical protein GMRT_12326 [Giardia muris]|uniref:Uncharacterized protein n=1 Tax=Giardia muris TaxID=5742 RepID=A0A4Z1SR85_GIAMU|nr:hypothetical protein GMRT_12326 [Giardia muris]|eukprot:TNJ28366.1 hypothetical protein GMRT_12326 [Giardia muris]
MLSDESGPTRKKVDAILKGPPPSQNAALGTVSLPHDIRDLDEVPDLDALLDPDASEAGSRTRKVRELLQRPIIPPMSDEIIQQHITEAVASGLVKKNAREHSEEVLRLLYDDSDRPDYETLGPGMAIGIVPTNELYRTYEEISAAQRSETPLRTRKTVRDVLQAYAPTTDTVDHKSQQEAEVYAAFLPKKPFQPTHFDRVSEPTDEAIRQTIAAIMTALPASVAISCTRDFRDALRSSSLLRRHSLQWVARNISLPYEPCSSILTREDLLYGDRGDCIYAACLRAFLHNIDPHILLLREDFQPILMTKSRLADAFSAFQLAGEVPPIEQVVCKDLVQRISSPDTEPHYKDRNTNSEIVTMASAYGDALRQYLQACDENIYKRREQCYHEFVAHKRNERDFQEAVRAVGREEKYNDTTTQLCPAGEIPTEKLRRQVEADFASATFTEGSGYLDKDVYDPIEAVQRLTDYEEAHQRVSSMEYLLDFFQKYHELNVMKDLDPQACPMILTELANTIVLQHPCDSRELAIAPSLDEILTDLGLQIEGANPFKPVELEVYRNFVDGAPARGDNGTAATLINLWSRLEMPIMERLELFSVIAADGCDFATLIELWSRAADAYQPLAEGVAFITSFNNQLAQYVEGIVTLDALEARRDEVWQHFGAIATAISIIRPLGAEFRKRSVVSLTLGGQSYVDYVKGAERLVATCKASMPASLFQAQEPPAQPN